MLRRLQKRGLIRRETHPDDSRANSVQLTEQGIALLAVLERNTKNNRREMENLFSPDELVLLISMLRRLINHQVP